MSLEKDPAPDVERSSSVAPVGSHRKVRLRELTRLMSGQRGLIAVIVVLSILGAGAALAQPVVVAEVIAEVERGGGIGMTAWLLFALVLAAGILSAFQQYFLQRMGETVVLNARERLIRRIFRLPMSEYDHRSTGDLVSRVGSDTTLLRAALIQGIVAAVGGSLTFVGALIGMAVLDPVLLGVTLGVVVLSFLVVTALGSSIQTASNGVQTIIGSLAAAVERNLRAIRTVRAANATEREETGVIGLARDSRRAGLRLAKIAAVVSPISGLATQVSFLAVLGVGGLRVASGTLSIADLIAFVLFLSLMIMPLSQAFEAVTAVSQALGAYQRIQEILELPSEDSDAGRPAAGRETPPATPRIEFRSVAFSYPAAPATDADEPPQSDRPVLADVSFAVPRGSRVALVGPSGGGKSSILQLIERFYRPSAGEILVDGVDIAELRPSALRDLIGYVEQDAPVLSGTIRTNLTLGAPTASEEECLAVLRAVNLHELVERDAKGLDATVGESGVTLSGGERQRLAIARTLITGAPILLLDESTSSLDGKNEQLMREAINAVSAERTLLVVAHRLSTVIESDQILVVEGGRIIGRGTHAELLDSTELYRELAEHQLLARTAG